MVPTTLNGTLTGPTLTAFGPAAATATLSADSIDFGSQAAGGLSQSATVTVTNTGAAPLSLGQPVLNGADASSFTARGDGCSDTTLAPGASCDVSIAFAPASAGQRSAMLIIPAGDGLSHTVSISADATAAASPPSPTPTLPSPTTGSGSKAPLQVISAALRKDRAIVLRRATVRELKAHGRVSVRLMFPTAGTITVQVAIAGHHRRHATVIRLARKSAHRSGMQLVTLRASTAARHLLGLRWKGDRVLVSFRTG